MKNSIEDIDIYSQDSLTVREFIELVMSHNIPLDTKMCYNDHECGGNYSATLMRYRSNDNTLTLDCN